MRKLQSADYVFIIGLIILVFIAGSVIYLVFTTETAPQKRETGVFDDPDSSKRITQTPEDFTEPDFKPRDPKIDPDKVAPDRPKPEYDNNIVWPNYPKWDAPPMHNVTQQAKIEGVVLDVKGNVIEDVEVNYTPVDISSGNVIGLSLQPWTSSELPAPAEQVELSKFRIPQGLSVAIKTKTDSNGKFVLPYSSNYFVITLRKQFYYENTWLLAWTGEEVVLTLDKWGALIGRVLDSAKYPMTNFRVEIFNVDENKRAGLSDILPSGHEKDGITYFRYKYYVGNKLFGCYLGEGTYEITVTVDTYISVRARYNITRNMELNNIFIVLKQTILKGFVVPENNPEMRISDASVTLQEIVSSGYSGTDNRRTGKDGGFFFSQLKGGSYLIRVAHAQYGTMEEEVYVPEGEIKEHFILLPVGNYLEGRVINEDNKPVAYANVMIEAFPPRRDARIAPKDSITDESGRFVISQIEPGSYKVVVRTAESYLGYEQIFTVVEGPNSLTIKLIFGVKVVLHMQSDDEIPQSIYVTLERDLAKSPMPYKELIEGDDRNWSPARGFYGAAVQAQQDSMHFNATFQGVHPGHYIIRITHQDVLDYDEPLEVPGDVRELHHNITISGGLKIAGQVVDPANKPLERASILISKDGKNERWITTDEEGKFETKGFVRNETYHLIAEFRGFKSYDQRIEMKESITNLVIKLETGATLTGIVLAPNGEPMPEVNVQLQAPPRGTYEGFPFAKTDEAGRFEFTGLKSGTYKIEIFQSGYILDKDIQAQVPGNITIQLKKGLSISGFIKNNRGEFVTDASIMVFETDPNNPDSKTPSMGRPPKGQGFTRADGRYSIDGLKPGRYVILAMHRDYPEYRESVQVSGDTQHTVIFEDGLSLIGSLKTASGKIPEGAYITLALKGTDEYGRSDSINQKDGSFKVQPLAKGTYILRVIQQPSRMVVYQTEVTIPYPSALNLVIEEQNIFTIEGTLVDNSGLPIPFAFFKVSKKDDRYYQGNVKCDSVGSFSLENVMPGEYTFVAMTRNNDILTPTFSVKVTNSNVTNLVFKANAVIAGVRVSRVVPDGIGDKAGIKVGDIIFEYNGNPVSTSRALIRACMQSIGQFNVQLKLNRDGKTLTLTVEPGFLEIDFN